VAQCPFEPEERDAKARIELQCLAGLSNRLVLAAGIVQRARQIRVHDQGEWIELARALLLSGGLFVAAEQ
jgi:hypothetical protein